MVQIQSINTFHSIQTRTAFHEAEGEKQTTGKGCLKLLCTLPDGHWIRANIQCGHCKVVCLFKQETSGGRDATVETRSEPYDETKEDKNSIPQCIGQSHIITTFSNMAPFPSRTPVRQTCWMCS